MTGSFLFLFCVGMFANDALAFPAEGPPGPKSIKNPNRCLLLTPDREAQVEIAVERITKFIHNLTEELELIDLKYLNIVIDGHYDTETEDTEMVLELTVNSCPRTEVKVADEAIDADDGVKEAEGEVNGEEQEEEDHKDVSNDEHNPDDGDISEDMKNDFNDDEVREEKQTDSIVDGDIDVVNGDADATANDKTPILDREEEIKIEDEDEDKEEEIRQPHQQKIHHGHKHVDVNKTLNEEKPINNESVEESKVNDEEANDHSNLSHQQHYGHQSHRQENVAETETENNDVDKIDMKDNPVETHHHRAYHHHSHHDDKQVQNNAQDASNTEITEDVTKAEDDPKEEITENKAEIFVNSNLYITGRESDNERKLCYCTEIQPQDLPQTPGSNIEDTFEERDGFNDTSEFEQEIVPALFNLQLPDNGVELLKEIGKKTGNGPVLVYVQNWEDAENRRYVIFSN